MKKQVLCILLLAGLVLVGTGCIVPHPYHAGFGYSEPGYYHYDHGSRYDCYPRHHGGGHHHHGGGLHARRR